MGLSLLFIDDDENLLNGIGRILKTEHRGVSFSFGSGADKALDLLESKNFDAVITDYSMPGINGLELLALVKERHPSIKRVLLTGRPEEGIIREAEPIVDLYMSKPCDISELVSRIEKMISPRENI